MTMKKSTFSLFVFGLALTLLMYNCKKSDPLEPDADLVEDLNKIEVAPVTIVAPTPVTSTPSSVTASAKTAEVANAIGSIATSGVVPASVKTSAAEVSGALSPTEVSAMATVTPATLAAVAGGGALPTDLKAVLDKAAANTALKAYLPSFTLPAVNGQAVNGRSGASVPETIAQTDGLDGLAVSDECIAKAEEALKTVIAKLDATKAGEMAKVEQAYQTVIAALAGNEATCTAGIPAKYTALRTAAQAIFDKTNTDLDAAQAVLGADYALLKALNSISYLGYLSTLNTLQSADVKACSSLTTAATAAAQAARTTNTAAVNAAYSKALGEANAAKAELLQSCHNQG